MRLTTCTIFVMLCSHSPKDVATPAKSGTSQMVVDRTLTVMDCAD